MYRVGDLIQYGGIGVCRMAGTVKQNIGDGERLFYAMTPLYYDGTIFAPVDSEKLRIRPILSREEADRLIDGIRFLQPEAYHTPVLGQLAEHYELFFKTNDCADLVALTMSIYTKKREAEQGRRKLGAVDERYMKRAEDLLFGELAAALGIGRSDVPRYIAARVENRPM